MGEKRMDPKQQFSKWLARSGAWYWFLFMTGLIGLMYFRPETGESCVWLGLIVSVVMMVHVWAYSRNSIYEKVLLTTLDKTKLELTLGKTHKTEQEDEDEMEGESNG